MKSMLSAVSFCLIVSLTMMVLPTQAFATQVFDTMTYIEDGVFIETVRFEGTKVESVREGTKTITTITFKDGKTEVVEADSLNPIFTVTSNGKTKTYDRSDYLASEGESQISLNEFYDPYYGSPYTQRLCGTKVIGDGHGTAFAYESYHFNTIDFDVWDFAARTAISVIIGVVAGALAPWSVVWQIIIGVGAAVGGGSSLLHEIQLTMATTEQEWIRECYIGNVDWAVEWRRVQSSLTGVDSQGKEERRINVHQDWASRNYYDILDHAIEMYLLNF